MKETDFLLQRRSFVDSSKENDAIAGHGYFHMERMSDSHIWFTIAGYTFDLTAVRGAHGLEIRWTPQAPEWPKASTL